MKGLTKITLNQETVVAAVQAYLDEHLNPVQFVTEFKPVSSYAPYQYEVTVSETEPEETPAPVAIAQY